MSTSPTTATAAPSLQMGPAEWALLVVHSALWGSSYFFIAVAKNDLPAFTIATARLLPAFLLLWAVVQVKKLRLPARWRDWLPYVPLALTNNFVPFVLTIWAQHQVTGGMAAVFCATTPLFAIFLAHMLTHDEKLSALKVIGVVVGILGVAILALPDLAASSSASLLAKLALLTAACLYAIGGIYARSLHGIPPLVMSTAQMATTFVLTLPLTLLIDQPWSLPAPSWHAVAAVIGTGIIASGLASICYFTLIKRAGATNALLVTLLLPLTPIVLGGLFLGEVLTSREWAGAAVIALALLIIDGRVVRAVLR